MDEGGSIGRLGLEGGLGGLPIPFGGAVCRDHTLLLLPASREMAVGFDLFLSSCAAFPDCACVQLFRSLIVC